MVTMVTLSRGEEQAVGWFIVMALPAAAAFSVVTAAMGMVIRLLFQAGVVCIQMARQRNVF
jgi:hypothetical protein